MNETKQQKDQLSPAEYNQYRQEVLNQFIRNQQPSLMPEAYVLSGQPGSGKSTLSEITQDELKDKGGSVVIDVDACRELHPKWQQFKQEDSKTAAQRTHAEAASVADDLRTYAISKRYNIVEDGTLKNPDWAKKLVDEQLKSNGYTVHSVGMCVTPEVSWEGCQKRYERTGRAVEKEMHDGSLTGVARSQQELVRQGKIDHVALYNREGQIYYKSAIHHQNDQEREKTCQVMASVYNRNGGRELPEDASYKRQQAQAPPSSEQKPKNPMADKYVNNPSAHDQPSPTPFESRQIATLNPSTADRAGAIDKQPAKTPEEKPPASTNKMADKYVGQSNPRPPAKDKSRDKDRDR